MTILFITLLATFIGLGVTVLIVPGISTTNPLTFFMSATALGLVNVFIRPVLWFLTAPLSVLTFGLFALVINALMIMLVAALIPGFEVKGFGSALLGALVMALTGAVGFAAIILLSGGDVSWYSYEYHSQTLN